MLGAYKNLDIISSISAIIVNGGFSISIIHITRKNCVLSAFPRIRTEYGDLLYKFPYSVQTQENADQRNSEYRHFSRSESDFMALNNPLSE